MRKKYMKYKTKATISLIIIFLLSGIFISVSATVDIDAHLGFDKGPSYTTVIPMKKTTLVNFDYDNIYDDYAYLAAIPTSVFNDNGILYSNPLIFYQDKMDIEDDGERSFDAYTGIKYLMEDWSKYCNNNFDQITLINVNESKMDSDWKAKNTISIDSENPYEIAKLLALQDWSYSNNAVVAVIDEEFEVPEDNEITDKVSGVMPSKEVKNEILFTTKQTNSLNPVSESFKVEEGYKQLFVEIWWDGAIIGGKMVPAGDPDFQLSYKSNEGWMQAQLAAEWNVFQPAGHEYKQTYVYQPGDWRVTVTDFPTQSEAPRSGITGVFEVQGSILGIFKKEVNYNIEIFQYPGVNIEIPDIPSFGVKNAEFKLTWEDPNVKLGFTIIGPSGEALHTEYNESRDDNQEIYIERLGECPEGEHYQISVYSLEDVKHPVEFEVEYSWEEAVPKEKGDAFDSATNGAVLASSLNAPLLYVTPTEVPSETKDVLYKLGVNDIYFVDIGNHASEDVQNEIENIADNYIHYTDCIDLIYEIREISGSNDIIFTSMDPWTSWDIFELVPDEEFEGALYIGPAAYIAAHHGSPVLIVEQYPKLSSAVTWHNEFWRRYSKQRGITISVADVVLSGKKVYDFLREYDYDKEGDETIITVAGQYEIGTPWDRTFPGVANAGRICGTPIDASVWISRSMFYPALIYTNPAVQGPVTVTQGSSSERQGLIGLLKKPRFNTLVITEGHEEEVEYPFLCTFVTVKHRFNERASKYYGSQYQGADGMTPGVTSTMDPIDQGSIKKYTGKDGMYYPDICNSEVVPFYLEKGGYTPVFSTRMEEVVNDLNAGTICWVHSSHGNEGHGGQSLFWDPQSGYNSMPLTNFFRKNSGASQEYNPWRGYDWLLGSTYEPDSMCADLQGMIPFTNIHLNFLPAMGLDWGVSIKPIREKLVNMPIFGPLFDIFIDVDDQYDGVTGALEWSKLNLEWKNWKEIEENLENLHSAGFMTGICQTSSTYFHLMLIRHGSVFQVQDPWPTSWYSVVWQQSIPRDIILGNTVGEAYSNGIAHVGPLFLGGGPDGGPQWWWDSAENVIFFGDPDLRMYVPENDYSNMNNWDKPKSLNYDEELNLDGHTPYGAMSYPHEKEQLTFLQKNLFVIIILAIIILLLIALSLTGRKKRR